MAQWAPPLDRILADTVITESCWLFNGPLDSLGYGHINVGGRAGKRVNVHRFMYEWFFGTIPPGLCVCHRCDVPNCFYPGHLWLGTHKENMRDCWAKGRQIPRAGELHGQSVLTTQIAREIREAVARGVSQAELARRFGVKNPCIRAVASGQSWKNAGGPIHVSRGFLSAADVEQAEKLHREGWTMDRIGALLGFSRQAISLRLIQRKREQS